MRHLVFMGFAILLICFVMTPGYAVGKTTVDPNTPEARASTDQETVDERIAQKVTYEAESKSVLTILDDLSEMTGVTLKAGYNNSDWQVRDRKMNIFAKDVPLGHLMNSIARVMMFKWSINEDADPPTYRLYMDRRTLVSAENQYLRQEQKAEQELAEKREEMLTGVGELANLSDEQLAALKEEEPLLYFVAKTGVAGSMGTFFSEVPAASEAIATGQELNFTGSDLSPAGQQGLANLMRVMSDIDSKFTPKEHYVPVPDDLLDRMGEIQVKVNEGIEEIQGNPLRSAFLGQIRMTIPDVNEGRPRHVGIPFLNWEHPIAKVMGRIVTAAMEEDRPMQELFKEFGEDFQDAFVATMKTEEFGEPVTDHSGLDDDPDLQHYVKMDKDKRALAELQAELASVSGMPVVSDSYPMVFGRVEIGDEEIEVLEVLDRIADAFRYNWDKHDRVLELRSRDWYSHRMAQIPEAWLEEWREVYKTSGTLDIGYLAQIAMLTQKQLNGNLWADETLRAGNMARAIGMSRDILRFYASLDDHQRAVLFSPSGLDLAYLTVDQWPYAQKLISRKNNAFLGNPDAHIAAFATREPEKEKLFNYTFQFTTTDDLKPLEWEFTTPEYKEPPKKELKPEKVEPEKPDAEEASSQPDEAPDQEDQDPLGE